MQCVQSLLPRNNPGRLEFCNIMYQGRCQGPIKWLRRSPDLIGFFLLKLFKRASIFQTHRKFDRAFANNYSSSREHYFPKIHNISDAMHLNRL